MPEDGNITGRQWQLELTDNYETKFKKYYKNHPNECIVVLDRLDTFLKAIQACDQPQQVIRGWIHPEPKGVKAIIEKGAGKNLRATRLYVFPEKNKRLVYVLSIGDKDSQRNDIKECCSFVDGLRAEQSPGT
jgi:hypothetical protein